jgi:hypothetical protein
MPESDLIIAQQRNDAMGHKQTSMVSTTASSALNFAKANEVIIMLQPFA